MRNHRAHVWNPRAATKEYNAMKKSKVSIPLFIFVLAASAFLTAQVPNPTTQASPQFEPAQITPQGTLDNLPLYKIEVVARDIPAINYFHRSGSTRIGFQGTELLPQATGEAKVESKLGRTVIDVNLRGLTPANGFGKEYLTYVLWAITPEGRPINLGEVLPTGGKNSDHFTVTTNLQAFGLIVTAEPYFAVTMPSNLVVMQNYILPDKTQGVIEPITAHYFLLPRGAYAETAGRHAVLHPITRDERSPLALYEAMNAVQIAEAAGAGHYAADTMATATTALQNAQDLDMHKGNRKETITYAREAVQAAEDARIITIRKIKAEDEAEAQQARVNAEQEKRQAQAVAEQQAIERQQADAEAQRAREEAQRAREAEQQAELNKQQADQEAAQARERLRAQLNQVLQTTETARGLIVNMNDVLFDFNKYTLKPEAREKLAKVSGILLAYPNLKLQVEGYTDNIGSDEYNQKLSEERADSVRDFLLSQSVPDSDVTAAGYGKSDPVADNSTSAGRAENRRVELVVSGAAIGIAQSTPGSQSLTQPGQNAAPSQSAFAPGRSGVSNPPQ